MLGNNIKALRMKKGLSQQELAKLLYVERSTVAKWEANINIPRLDSLERIAEVLEVTADSLIENINLEHTENKEMSNLNEKFINLKSLEETQEFINDILTDFRFDQSNEETMKMWIVNYLYATILSELNYRDGIMKEEDDFDIFNLVVDLEDDALNGLFRDNFRIAFDKLMHMEANEREEITARIYEVFSNLKKPENIESTILNLSIHIKRLALNKKEIISKYTLTD